MFFPGFPGFNNPSPPQNLKSTQKSQQVQKWRSSQNGIFGIWGIRYTPIQTSPNWPLPRRLISCSDSRGISHTSLVLTDRSVRRGMPLWHGTISLQHRPAALAEITVQFGVTWEMWKCKRRRKKNPTHNIPLRCFCTHWAAESHPSSAALAAGVSQTGLWWWCSSLHYPVCGFYSV